LVPSRPEVQPKKKASAHQAEDRNEVEEHWDQLFTLTSFLPQTSHFLFTFSPSRR
jgi:hypothetical protein